MYPLPQLRALGAIADARQAQLLVDLGTDVVTPLGSSTHAMPNVAKYEPELHKQLVVELQALYNATNSLEQEINLIPLPVSADTERVIAKKIDTLAKLAEDLRLRVSGAARAGVEQKQLRTVIGSVTIGAIVVGLGWWLASRAKPRKGRRG